MSATRPKVTEITPCSCQRHSCKGCPCLTSCRETYKRSLPPREGD